MEQGKVVILVQEVFHGLRWRFYESYEKALSGVTRAGDRMLSCPEQVKEWPTSEQRKLIEQRWDSSIEAGRLLRRHV